MSLPAGQQRILDAIAGALQVRDPRLAGMFAVFTRLTRAEPMPASESIDGGRLRRAARRLRQEVAPPGRLRALVIIPVVLAAIAALIALGPVSGSPPCGRLAGRAFIELAGRFSTCAGRAGAGGTAGHTVVPAR